MFSNRDFTGTGKRVGKKLQSETANLNFLGVIHYLCLKLLTKITLSSSLHKQKEMGLTSIIIIASVY